MKIANIETWAVKTRLSEPYTIAYETIDSVTNLFMRIETDNGITGFGSASPDLELTGETPQTVLDTCNNIIIPALKGRDPLRPAQLMKELETGLQNRSSTAAMLDMALWDILGKKAGLPLYKLLGGYREKIETSITIGIMSIAETIARAREFVKKGFKVLKIKGGKEVEADIQRVIKVREAVGKDIKLRFDANQGYTVKESLELLKAVRTAKLEILEQPTPKEQPQLLGQVRNGQDNSSSRVPVMADESLLNVDDAFYLAKHSLVNSINVKLMKVGGISNARRIDAVAKAANQKLMVGCMDESALAIAAGLHFALSSPNVIYADLDGHLDLIDDPLAGAVILKEGVLYPNSAPGLGGT
ncbi:MAG: dipeptide epimerase, partial [bacterium]|nr:dipeptide epimerase [bacterium]